MVDDEFEDEAFAEDDEAVESDAVLDDIDELEELDEEFEDDDVAELVLGVEDDADAVVADEDQDDDVVEEDVPLDDELDEDEEEILGFGEKALGNDELLDFVDDTKEDLGIPSVPIGEGEFTCRSCFIVKRRSQLADEKKLICFDCA